MSALSPPRPGTGPGAASHPPALPRRALPPGSLGRASSLTTHAGGARRGAAAFAPPSSSEAASLARRRRLGSSGGGAVSPPPPDGGGGGGKYGGDSESDVDALTTESLHLNRMYMQSRVRLLATTAGGFSYIPSPLSRKIERPKVYKPAGANSATGGVGYDRLDAKGGSKARSAAAGGAKASGGSAYDRERAKAVARRHLEQHFAEARAFQMREAVVAGGPVAARAAAQAKAAKDEADRAAQQEKAERAARAAEAEAERARRRKRLSPSKAAEAGGASSSPGRGGGAKAKGVGFGFGPAAVAAAEAKAKAKAGESDAAHAHAHADAGPDADDAAAENEAASKAEAGDRQPRPETPRQDNLFAAPSACLPGKGPRSAKYVTDENGLINLGRKYRGGTPGPPVRTASGEGVEVTPPKEDDFESSTSGVVNRSATPRRSGRRRLGEEIGDKDQDGDGEGDQDGDQDRDGDRDRDRDRDDDENRDQEQDQPRHLRTVNTSDVSSVSWEIAPSDRSSVTMDNSEDDATAKSQSSVAGAGAVADPDPDPDPDPAEEIEVEAEIEAAAASAVEADVGHDRELSPPASSAADAPQSRSPRSPRLSAPASASPRTPRAGVGAAAAMMMTSSATATAADSSPPSAATPRAGVASAANKISAATAGLTSIMTPSLTTPTPPKAPFAGASAATPRRVDTDGGSSPPPTGADRPPPASSPTPRSPLLAAKPSGSERRFDDGGDGDRSGKALASAILTAIRGHRDDPPGPPFAPHLGGPDAEELPPATMDAGGKGEDEDEDAVPDVAADAVKGEEGSAEARAGAPEVTAETAPTSAPTKRRRYYSPAIVARWDNCIYVRAEGGRTGTLTITESHLVFAYDDFYDDDDDSAENGGGDSNSNSNAEKEDTGSQYESGFDTDSEDEGRRCGPRTDEDAAEAEADADADANAGGGRDDPTRPDRALHDITGRPELHPDEDEPPEVRLMRARRDRKLIPATASWDASSTAYPSSSSSSGDSGSYVDADTDVDADVDVDVGVNVGVDVDENDISDLMGEDGGLFEELAEGALSPRCGRGHLRSSSSLCADDSVDDAMNTSLIRAIEEEARRRLQELDDEATAGGGTDGGGGDLCAGANADRSEGSTVGSAAAGAHGEGRDSGQRDRNAEQMWEREHLRDIERRARKYLRKLDDDYDEDDEDDEDDEEDTEWDEASVASSGIDQARVAAWRRKTRGLPAEGEDDDQPEAQHEEGEGDIEEDDSVASDDDDDSDGDGRREQPALSPGGSRVDEAADDKAILPDQDQESGGEIGHHHIALMNSMNSEEERRWYTTGPPTRVRYRGIKWPLDKLSEVYPRRYMMRDVAFEIYAPYKSQLFAASSAALSSGLLGGSNNKSDGVVPQRDVRDSDIPLGVLSESSVYFAVPDTDVANTEEEDDPEDGGQGKPTDKKSRREQVIDALRGCASNLVLAHWHLPGDTATSSNGGEGIRQWTASLFRRRSHSPPGGICFAARGPLQALTRAWRRGYVSNYDYLIRLNSIAGRSRHDPSHYPVMPWVLANYTSHSVPDLTDKRNYRDMTKPMGALDVERLQKFMEKYMSLYGTSVDGGGYGALPPFMYGSHYSSTGGVVLHYLVRVRPFAGLHRQLQGGRFDVADRLFYSVPHTYEMCSRTSPTEVKELTPEWYSDPSFLRNANGFDLGTSVSGKEIGDVELPPWAEGSPDRFVQVMRDALESDICSRMIPGWIDLIFGFKQRGSEARKAFNVFYHLTYYDTEDLAKIEDEELRTETELHIADFGHCPTQLFFKPHPWKKPDALRGDASSPGG